MDFDKVVAYENQAGKISKGQYGYVIDGKLNDSFTAVNILFNNKINVKRVDKAGNGVNPGDFIVPASTKESLLKDIAQKTGVGFAPLNKDATSVSRSVKRLRIGMYQRYLGGNMDEGWTRLLLERFEFPYSTMFDKDIKASDLIKKYDVIILPDDGLKRMTGKNMSDNEKRRWESYPPEYRSGFGQAGIDALRNFVEQGGTLLTFGKAGELPIKELKVPIRNVVENVSSKDFWSPGSTLRLNIDNSNPLAYGMPATGLALFVGDNDVYQVIPTPKNENIERIATFVDRDLMESGWLIGEDVIADKAAMVSVKMKKGKVVMIGFRPQHRVQTHGTFKFVFNALVSGPE
jgi:hypothetical protein